MDIQTRKLTLISFLAQLKDENFLYNIEQFILKERKSSRSEFEELTVEDLSERIRRSEEDFAVGNVQTQEELEKISGNW